MKRILTYTTFCLLLVFASCSEEQLEVYHGDNYVYFTYMIFSIYFTPFG